MPEDLGARLDERLREEEAAVAPRAGSRGGAQLDLHFKPLPGRPGRPAGRVWDVKAFGESLTGTLVDLPCHVETHVVPKPAGLPGEDGTSPAAYKSADGASPVAFKSADIFQMLIVHRGPEPPDAAKCLDRRTFQWCSGLTPPTERIRQRKFRGRPPAGSEFAADRIAEAEAAIRERLNGEPYVYEELSEVDEAFHQEILRTQPENVWRPPPERASDAQAAGEAGSRTSAAKSAAASGSAASRARAVPRRGLPSVVSASSGGSGGGSSAVAARAGPQKRAAAGSAVSDGAASGSAAVPEGAVGSAAGSGEAERRPAPRRLKLK